MERTESRKRIWVIALVVLLVLAFGVIALMAGAPAESAEAEGALGAEGPAVAAESSHGFCVGWAVFIFMMLELLYLGCMVVLWIPQTTAIVKKCKAAFLLPIFAGLNLIGILASQATFLFALIALCRHQCGATVTCFVFAVLIFAAFLAMYILNRRAPFKDWVEEKKRSIAEGDAPVKKEDELVIAPVLAASASVGYYRITKVGEDKYTFALFCDEGDNLSKEKGVFASEEQALEEIAVLRKKGEGVKAENRARGAESGPAPKFVLDVDEKGVYRYILVDEEGAVLLQSVRYLNEKRSLQDLKKALACVTTSKVKLANGEFYEEQAEEAASLETAPEETPAEIAEETAAEEVEETSAETPVEEQAPEEAPEESAPEEAPEEEQPPEEAAEQEETIEEAPVEEAAIEEIPAEEAPEEQEEAPVQEVQEPVQEAVEASVEEAQEEAPVEESAEPVIEEATEEAAEEAIEEAAEQVAEAPAEEVKEAGEVEAPAEEIAPVEDVAPIEETVEEAEAPEAEAEEAAEEVEETAVEEAPAEAKEEPIEEVAAAPAEPEEAAAPESDEASAEELFAKAESIEASYVIDKQFVADYLGQTYGDEVACEVRGKKAKNGEPLPDIHYATAGDASVSFLAVYDVKGRTVLFIKASEQYGAALIEKHASVKKSTFPKSGEPCFALIADDGFDADELMEIIDDVYSAAQKTFG